MLVRNALYAVAFALLIYIVRTVFREKKFSVAEALAALGIVVTLFVAPTFGQAIPTSTSATEAVDSPVSIGSLPTLPPSTAQLKDSNATSIIATEIVATQQETIVFISQSNWICSGEGVASDAQHVTIERLGSCHLSLLANEVIIGTADRFQDDMDLPEQPQPPCTAFAIKGPIEMDLRIWWGGWDYHSNLDEASMIPI